MIQQDFEQCALTVSLSGPLTAMDSAGQSRLPKSAKARGLLVLVVTGEGMARPRSWLQDMLWSDRAQPQRAASLRQALSELRRALGPMSRLLRADRQTVHLDPQQVKVTKRARSPGAGILEGLSVADPAFQAWLTQFRALNERPATPPSAAPKPNRKRVVLVGETDDGSALAGVEMALLQTVTQSLQEICAFQICSPKTLQLHPDCILISAKAIAWTGGKTRINTTIEDIGSGRVCWQGRGDLSDALRDPFDSVAFLSLCNRTADAAYEAQLTPFAAAGGSPDAHQVAQLAIRKLFSISREDVAEALNLFELAYSIDPQPLVQAWRAQTLTIQYVERYVPLDAALRDQNEEACRKALAEGHRNSTILAAVANARTNINKNYAVGLELSLQAVQLNPANAMAWYAYSNAIQCLGRSEEAYQAALVSQALAQTTRMKFWCDCQVSIAAAMSGRPEVATRFGERSHALAPDFRPPLRYLTALYALDARSEDVSRTITSLRAQEPDFTVDQMIRDPNYPIGIMRRYGRKFTNSLRKYDLE